MKHLLTATAPGLLDTPLETERCGKCATSRSDEVFRDSPLDVEEYYTVLSCTLYVYDVYSTLHCNFVIVIVI